MRKSLLYGSGIALLLMLMVLDTASALDAKEIVSSFRKKYENMKNFNADFEQTTIVAGEKRVSRGKLNFQKPNLLKQEYFDPSNPENMTQLIVSNGKTLWSYTPVISQVTKQTLVQDEDRMELLPGFGKSLENVEKNYFLSLVEDELAEKSGIHVVELVSKSQSANPNAMFDVLRVWIRDEDSALVQFMYKDKKNEMTFVLSFKNVKSNEDLDESMFEFKVPRGVQIITVPQR